MKIMKVNYELIREQLNKGRTIFNIHIEYDIPESIIKKIKEGKNIDQFMRRIKKEGIDWCDCCKMRPKEEGFKYLCIYCFKNQGDIGIVSEHRIMIPRREKQIY